jgi:Tfp pilus assembly protein PilO
MNSPINAAPQSMSMFREASVRELQQFYKKPIARVSTELAITILTVIFLALFAIRPTLNTMSSLLKDIDDKTKVNQDLTKKAAALSTLNSEIVPLNSQIALLDTVIPDVPDIDGLLRRIERVASGRPIVLNSIQSDLIPKDHDPSLVGTPQLSGLTLTVGVKGTYANVIDYMRALLSMDRELSVVSMTITTDKTSNSTGSSTGSSAASATPTSPNLQMSLVLQAHYYGIPVEKAPGTP